ncbi:MAG: NfeD family protein [Rikenellaceae bacterium]
MLLIFILLILGGLFIIAELILFPGVSLAGIMAVASFTWASFIAFNDYGQVAGYLIITAAIIVAILAVTISLRSKLWQKLSLKSKIKGTSQQDLEQRKSLVGSKGKTISRLAPMGKVRVNGEIFEASSQAGYIDQDTEIEVVGAENFNIIVKKL